MDVYPQTWEDIEQKYRGLHEDNEIRNSMLDLIAYVSKSDIGKSLHPWTSMFELKITQTEAHPFQDSIPFLQIMPHNDGGATFRYIDSCSKSKQWERVADKGRLIERFDSFVEQIGWRKNIIS